MIGAAVACALGMGATQALAAPEAASRDGTCSRATCNAPCVAAGYRYGICVDPDTCECYHF